MRARRSRRYGRKSTFEDIFGGCFWDGTVPGSWAFLFAILRCYGTMDKPQPLLDTLNERASRGTHIPGPYQGHGPLRDNTRGAVCVWDRCDLAGLRTCQAYRPVKKVRMQLDWAFPTREQTGNVADHSSSRAREAAFPPSILFWRPRKGRIRAKHAPPPTNPYLRRCLRRAAPQSLWRRC